MLNAPRKTAIVAGSLMVLPKDTLTVIYPGALTAITAAGKAVPAEKAADQPAIGCCVHVNDDTVTVHRGAHLWDNDSTAGKVTQAHVGKSCYILDDATVTSVDTGSSVAGKVLGFEGDQVIVETL